MQQQTNIQETVNNDDFLEGIHKLTNFLSGKKHRLTILIKGSYRHFVQLWIFVGDKKKIYESQSTKENEYLIGRTLEEYNFHLSKDRYTIRIYVDGRFADTIIYLNKDLTCSIGEDITNNVKLMVPKIFSAVPMSTDVLYESSYDYYAEAAQRTSGRFTCIADRDEGLDSGLFLFMRYPNQEIYERQFKGKEPWSKFALFDNNMNLVAQFPTGTSQDDLDEQTHMSTYGYLSFTAKLRPGMYLLKYFGKDRRTVPIHVFPNWFTQVFMTISAEPLFGSLKILINKTPTFNADNSHLTVIDVLLSKLNNNDYTLTKDLIDQIAAGKYHSPMLGLLGAYIYMLGSEIKNDGLFNIIVRNLQHKILVDSNHSPDLLALNILSYNHFGKPFDPDVSIELIETPMLKVAYDVLRKAAITNKWIIPEKSINDRIAEYQRFDSAFNTFKSFTKARRPKALSAEYDSLNTSQNLSDPPDNHIYYLKGIKKITLGQALSRGRNDVGLDRIDRSNSNDLHNFEKLKLPVKKMDAEFIPTSDKTKNPKKMGSVKSIVANMIRRANGITAEEIAIHANIPISTVERIRKELGI